LLNIYSHVNDNRGIGIESSMQKYRLTEKGRAWLEKANP